MRWGPNHEARFQREMERRRRRHRMHRRFAFWPTEMYNGTWVWLEMYHCRWAGKLTENDAYWIKEAL